MGRREGRQAGYQIVEAVVGTAIFAAVIAIVAVLFASLLAWHKRLAADAAQQQEGRAALDRLVEDLRLAGLNIDPDDAGRPDEAIEGMWPTACTLRLDEDMLDPDRRDDPERTLSGGAYAMVSTGNDEIVTWAIGAIDPSGSGVAFGADVSGIPRDGIVEEVRVAPTAGSTPTTLYRITVTEGGAVRRQPVIDGCLSLRFEYFDARGRRLEPAGGTEAGAARSVRGRIAAIGVRLEIASERAASQKPRPLVLETRVGVRTAGLFGGFGPDPPARDVP